MSEEGRMTERWYVVHILTPWSAVELADARGVIRAGIAEGIDADGCIGFLPVFDSVAAAERWRGDRAADTTAIRPLSRRLVADKERM